MPVALTSLDVLKLAPELAPLTSGQWAIVINDVKAEVAVAAFASQTRADSAAVWLAAHIGTVLMRGAANPPVQSTAVGGVSVTYATSVAESSSSLQSTSYGREYLRRSRQSFFARVL